jgi:hypothetical protein
MNKNRRQLVESRREKQAFPRAASGKILITDDEVWANSGFIEEPTLPKLAVGNERGVKPLAQHHNFQMHRSDSNVQAILREGVTSYSPDEIYPLYGFCRFEGDLYYSKKAENKNNPVTNSFYWANYRLEIINDIVSVSFSQDSMEYEHDSVADKSSFSILLKPVREKIENIRELIVTVNVDFKNSSNTYTQQVPIKIEVSRIAPKFRTTSVSVIDQSTFQIIRDMFISDDGSEYRIIFGIIDKSKGDEISLSTTTSVSQVLIHSRTMPK